MAEFIINILIGNWNKCAHTLSPLSWLSPPMPSTLSAKALADHARKTWVAAAQVSFATPCLSTAIFMILPRKLRRQKRTTTIAASKVHAAPALSFAAILAMAPPGRAARAARTWSAPPATWLSSSFSSLSESQVWWSNPLLSQPQEWSLLANNLCYLTTSSQTHRSIKL